MTHRKLQKIAPVQRKDWPRVIDNFNELNRGREIRLERYGGGAHEHTEQKAPLLSVQYDPAEREDLLVIAVGKERPGQEFRVESVKEIWVEPGDVEAGTVMELVDKDERHVVISLEIG